MSLFLRLPGRLASPAVSASQRLQHPAEGADRGRRQGRRPSQDAIVLEKVAPSRREAADAAVGQRNPKMDLVVDVLPTMELQFGARQLVMRPEDPHSRWQVGENVRNLRR